MMDRVYFYCSDAEYLKPILEQFAKKMRFKIGVKGVADCSIQVPYSEREFNLCIHFCVMSVPSEETQMHLAYGFRLQIPRQSACCKKIGKAPFGGKYIFDTDGFPVAVIEGKSLYILFALPSYRNRGTDHSGEILQLILDDYFLHYTHRNLFAKEMRKRQEDKNRRQFSKAFGMYVMETAINQIDATRREVVSLERTLSQKVRDLLINNGIRKSPFNMARVNQMHSDLCKLSSTGEINISSDFDQILIHVGQIEITNEGVTYLIGRFNIVFDVYRCKVMCKNLDSHQGCNHPHVDEHGYCDLGEASVGISVLLGRMEFVTVASMLIRFLQSYDRNTCLADVTNWPKKEVENG